MSEKSITEDWSVAQNGHVIFIVINGTENDIVPDVICSCGINSDHTKKIAQFISVAPLMYRKLDKLKNLFITFSYRLLRCKENKNAEQFMKEAMEIEKLLREARGDE